LKHLLIAESDPDFGAKAAAQLEKRKKVIVYCGRGGTIKTGFGNEKTGKFFKDDPERAFGIESRSLKACHELFEVRLTVQASATLSAIADLLLAGVPFRLMKFSARVLPLTVRNH
jgi:hypothetical protein